MKRNLDSILQAYVDSSDTHSIVERFYTSKEPAEPILDTNQFLAANYVICNIDYNFENYNVEHVYATDGYQSEININLIINEKDFCTVVIGKDSIFLQDGEGAENKLLKLIDHVWNEFLKDNKK